MQPQRTASPPPGIAAALRTARDTDLDGESSTQAAILGLLLGEDHHGLYSREELRRYTSAGPLDVTDAIAELIASGLVHELHGGFILASRAARAFDRLDL